MVILMVSSLATAQSIKIDAKGNYYTEVKTKVPDKLMNKSFTDALGEKYSLYITANNKLYYLKASSSTGVIGKHYIKVPEKPDIFDKPYSIKVIDEHEVRLYNGNEILVLYFENATVLSQEELVFIDHIIKL